MSADAKINKALQGLHSGNAKERDKHYFTLLPVSELTPEKLYHAWDDLASLLSEPELSKKFSAIHLLVNLFKVDKEDKFKKIFDEFYGLLAHESPVISPHIAGKSGKVIRAKPQLKKKILPKLLDIDKISKCRQPELIKAYVVESFDDCFDLANENEKEQILSFVSAQKDSISPKTRKKAKEFIIKWSPIKE